MNSIVLVRNVFVLFRKIFRSKFKILRPTSRILSIYLSLYTCLNLLESYIFTQELVEISLGYLSYLHVYYEFNFKINIRLIKPRPALICQSRHNIYNIMVICVCE